MRYLYLGRGRQSYAGELRRRSCAGLLQATNTSGTVEDLVLAEERPGLYSIFLSSSCHYNRPLAAYVLAGGRQTRVKAVPAEEEAVFSHGRERKSSHTARIFISDLA